MVKRKDACYWLRVLNPMSYLNERGHRCEDEVTAHQAVCRSCAAMFAESKLEYLPVEIFFDHEGDLVCPHCSRVMTTAEEGHKLDSVFFEKWRESIDQVIQGKDVIVFQRPTDLVHLRLMRKIKEAGVKLVQTCDDNYQNIPTWNNGYSYYQQRQAIVQESLRICDAIDVTTPALQKHYQKFNSNVVLLPNSLDMELIEIDPPQSEFSVYNGKGLRLSSDEYFEKRNGRKMILWGGSSTHRGDLNIIIPSLRRIVRQEDVCIGLVGCVHLPLLEVLPWDRVFMFGA
ncbi:MAG TPA: hypothetical protein V6C65_08475, partial [Allocoleopsis sp.]